MVSHFRPVQVTLCIHVRGKMLAQTGSIYKAMLMHVVELLRYAYVSYPCLICLLQQTVVDSQQTTWANTLQSYPSYLTKPTVTDPCQIMQRMILFKNTIWLLTKNESSPSCCQGAQLAFVGGRKHTKKLASTTGLVTPGERRGEI